MSITISSALEADLPQVAALFDLYRQFYEQAPDPALAREFIEARFARGESVLLVAQAAGDQGELVGFCQLYPSYCSVEAATAPSTYMNRWAGNATRCSTRTAGGSKPEAAGGYNGVQHTFS